MSTPTASTASDYVNMATRMASSPDAIEAGNAVKRTAQEIQQEVVTQDEYSLRVMTLIAGLAMMIASINGFLGKLATFQLDKVLMDAIVFSVGLAFVLLESGIIRLSVCAATDSVINDKAPFLRSLVGRGVVFVGTGMLEIYMRGILDTIVGCFAIYVGGMYLVTRYRAKQKLNAARGSSDFGLEKVQEQFAMADIDGQGALTLKQFEQFADGMGLALNKRETEAAFMQIDKSHRGDSGRLTYDAIQTWWSKGKK